MAANDIIHILLYLLIDSYRPFMTSLITRRTPPSLFQGCLLWAARIDFKRAHTHVRTNSARPPRVLRSISVPLRLCGLSAASPNIKVRGGNFFDAAWPAANTATRRSRRWARRWQQLNFGFHVVSALPLPPTIITAHMKENHRSQDGCKMHENASIDWGLK